MRGRWERAGRWTVPMANRRRDERERGPRSGGSGRGDSRKSRERESVREKNDRP